MRPRGYGRGWKSAAMRQARYQRYYTRGSNAAWTAERRADDHAYEALAIWFLKGIGAIALFGIVAFPLVAYWAHTEAYKTDIPKELVRTKRYAHQR